MVHDATEERRKRQELKVKTTMIQEVHHRVKNNLQTIAAVLRMQARRTKNEETLQALNEAITRILSVAVIHEFLSLDESQTINVRDVCQRIVSQNRQVMVAPGQQIRLLGGGAGDLPAEPAGDGIGAGHQRADSERGGAWIQHPEDGRDQDLARGSRRASVAGGVGRWRQAAGDFDLNMPPSLGLQIVRSLVQDDSARQCS